MKFTVLMSGMEETPTEHIIESNTWEDGIENAHEYSLRHLFQPNMGTLTDEQGYKYILSAPEGVMLNVRWGMRDQAEYGVAKKAHGKWWNYSSSNPHARGRQCATPVAWHSEYK